MRTIPHLSSHYTSQRIYHKLRRRFVSRKVDREASSGLGTGLNVGSAIRRLVVDEVVATTRIHGRKWIGQGIWATVNDLEMISTNGVV